MSKSGTQRQAAPQEPNTQILEEARRLLDSAPTPGPMHDPNMEPRPIEKLFDMKPGFWDSYFQNQR